MAEAVPRVYADDRGVWREDTAGHPFGITWQEIASVGGYKLDGITEVYTIVELDFEYGECLELCADQPGFAEVARAISERLPGIYAGWLAEVERLAPHRPPVTVWRRSEPLYGPANLKNGNPDPRCEEPGA